MLASLVAARGPNYDNAPILATAKQQVFTTTKGGATVTSLADVPVTFNIGTTTVTLNASRLQMQVV